MLGPIRLKWQILLAVGFVQLVGLAAGAALFLANARNATEIEIAASQESADALVRSALAALDGAEDPVAALAARLVQPRHVRLEIVRADGGRVAVPAAEVAKEEAAPRWFAALISPPPRVVRVPVIVDGQERAEVLLTTAPGDEIHEVWIDARALIWVAGAIFTGSIALLILIVGRALRPLDALGAGLRSLAGGDLTARVPLAERSDLALLVDRVNALAASLERAEVERTALHRRIVELGDAERKSIAMELHDELGPCLFGLKVKATAIRRTAQASGDDGLGRDAEAVLAIADQIQASNRRLLTTLRPMAIGQLPLRDAIADLFDGLRHQHSGIAWNIDLPERIPDTDETLDLTVYRFFQEGLTNALKHGAPTHIRVSIEVRRDRSGAHELRLAVEDNGSGIVVAPGGEGRGLPAMRDRVVSIGGRLSIGRGAEGGTRLAARLPLAQAAAAPRGIEAVS